MCSLKSKFPSIKYKTGWPWTEEVNPTAYKAKKNYPKITIITPNYNGANYLEQTIRSVLLQNYPNLEYIIIDGGSTDNSINIIKKYEKYLAYWSSEPDNGIYYAINKGIAKAKGDLIGNINSDDWYAKGVFDVVSKNSIKQPKSIIYGYLNLVEKEKEIGTMLHTHHSLDKYMFQHPTWFVPRSIYKNFGIYDTKYSIAADYEFACRIHQKKVAFHNIKKTLANHRIGGASYNLFEVTKQDLYIKKKYQYISSKTYFLKVIKNYLKHKI